MERTSDASDRRRNTVVLTDTGRTYLDDLELRLDDVQKALLEPLSGAERAQLCALLERVLDHRADRRDGAV